MHENNLDITYYETTEIEKIPSELPNIGKIDNLLLTDRVKKKITSEIEEEFYPF